MKPNPRYQANLASTGFVVHEPTTFAQAIVCPQWQKAMTMEYKGLLQQQTWILVPKPITRHAIGSKRVYKIKRAADGSNARYKTRLVVKGYS